MGNPLEWPLVDRCNLLSAMGLALTVMITAFVSRMKNSADLAVFFNAGILSGIYLTGCVLLLFYGSLLAAGLWMRRRHGGSSLLVIPICQGYAISTGIISGLTGSSVTPFGVLFFLVGMILGLLLLPWRPVWFAGGTGFAILLSHLFRFPEGLWSSETVVDRLPVRDGRLIPEWRVLFGLIPLGFSVLIVGLMAYTIARWRSREAKLALTYRELSATKDRLVRTESLAAVGSLVTGAAHELRNPLASSSGLLQSFMDDVRAWGDSDGRKAETLPILDLVMKGQRRAALIVDRLYKLTDDLVTHKSTVSLGASLDRYSEIYPDLAIELPADLRGLKLTHALVDTVLISLLDNAFAAGGSSPVRLQVRKNERNELEMSVSDSGRGIPKEVQSEVFKPFFTGNKAGEGHGVGLGLYIVHEVVTRMNGAVQLDSEAGKGTRVTVSVPLEG